MRILVVCDKGINRSVTIASLLKHVGDGHDTLAVGLATAAADTLNMLLFWADKVILTEPGQMERIPTLHHGVVEVWDVGPDVYPRPFNRQLLRKVQGLIDARFEQRNAG